MDFSHVKLNIDGAEYTSFGDIVIKQQCDGYGTSGVSTAQLTVSVSAMEYVLYGARSNAIVRFTVGETDSVEYVFYIANRRRHGGRVDFVCYDRMAFTDQYIDIEKITFVNDEIASYELVTALAEMAGIPHVDSGISSMGIFGSVMIPKEDIAGKTIRTVLEEISAAWCGYFKLTFGNALYFVPFGYGTTTGNYIKDHAAITEGDQKNILRIEMTDGTDTYYAGAADADYLDTLRVNTKYASQELAAALMARTDGCSYKSWSCSKAIVTDSLPDITADVSFGYDVNYRWYANTLTLTFTGHGVFMSCGSNEVTENEFEYVGKLSRQIAERIKDGEKLGNNTLLTRYQGLIHLAPTKSKSSSEKKQFGYSPADSNGVVQFDGALTSMVVPSSASINADKTEAVIDYGGKKYKYYITWDNGNISGFRKELIE